MNLDEETLSAIRNTKQYYQKIFNEIKKEYDEIMLKLDKEEEEVLKRIKEVE